MSRTHLTELVHLAELDVALARDWQIDDYMPARERALDRLHAIYATSPGEPRDDTLLELARSLERDYQATDDLRLLALAEEIVRVVHQ